MRMMLVLQTFEYWLRRMILIAFYERIDLLIQPERGLASGSLNSLVADDIVSLVRVLSYFYSHEMEVRNPQAVHCSNSLRFLPLTRLWHVVFRWPREGTLLLRCPRLP